MKILGYIFEKVNKFIKYCIKKYQKSKFEKIGKNVYIGNDCIFTYSNISIGNDVSIMNNCQIQSVHGKIEIGNKIMIGPGVHIHGGNHIFNVKGKYMIDCKKEANSDGKVVIEDDCWIGANSIILKGVTIGKGSVIGAGTTVTKSIPPYTVFYNKYEGVYRQRFSIDEIREHEQILEERASNDE